MLIKFFLQTKKQKQNKCGKSIIFNLHSDPLSENISFKGAAPLRFFSKRQNDWLRSLHRKQYKRSPAFVCE